MTLNIRSEKKHKISKYIFMQFAEPLGNSDSSVDAGWDHLNGCWRKKLVDKVRELSPTMIRFGGCFASYYHWKEGVGPQSSRVPMYNLCWDGVYGNAVGTHELVELCRTVDAQPLMVVNMESDGRMHWAYPKEGMNRLGTAAEAAEWVEYCNDPCNKLRLSHGVNDPYNVKYWQIGNETSYDRRGFDMRNAAKKTLGFAREMKKADPEISLIAWGDSGWAGHMIEQTGEYVDHVAFHYHFSSALQNSVLNDRDYRRDADATWQHLMSVSAPMERRINEMREQVAPYGKRLAMTEGHYALSGRDRCDVLSTWGAGVSYARCMLVIERATDILDIATLADFFGNRWQVNALMLSTPDHWGGAYLQPVGSIMSLFRHHIGEYALEAPKSIYGVDIASSISSDGGTVYLHTVNTDRTDAKDICINVDGIEVSEMTVYEIACDSMTEITYECPDVFSVRKRKVKGNKLTLSGACVAAIEINIYD